MAEFQDWWHCQLSWVPNSQPMDQVWGAYLAPYYVIIPLLKPPQPTCYLLTNTADSGLGGKERERRNSGNMREGTGRKGAKQESMNDGLTEQQHGMYVAP